MSYWYQYATTSNRLNRSYINGFVDISGGDLTLRNSNFNVNGLIAQNTSNISPAADRGPASVSYSYISWNDVSNNFLSSTNGGKINGSLTVTNDLSINGNLYINSQSNHQITVTATSFAVTEDMSLNGRLYVSSDASLSGRLFVGSDVSLSGRVNFLSDLSVNKRIFVNGDASFNSNVNIAGNLALPSTGTHNITGNITITGNTSCGNSTVNGNETVTGTETVGNLVVSNCFIVSASPLSGSTTYSLTQPLATIYFVNATAVTTITLPNPNTNGQVIHFRRYTTTSTTFTINFATATANFVVPVTGATGTTASISGTQTSTKFISYGSYWYQVYLQ